MGGHVAIWEFDRPLATAAVKLQGTAADELAPDSYVDVPTVHNGVSLLEGYAGDDKYLVHLRAVLRSQDDALQDAIEAAVLATGRP